MSGESFDRVIDALVARGRLSEFGVDGRANGYRRLTARCPAHDDRSPSLSVAHVGDKTVVNCFAGCEPDAVIEALGLSWPDLFDADPRTYTSGYWHGTKTKGNESQARALVAESFDQIRAERTRWLWDQRIPLGTATLLVGREKLGKSTLTTELAARLSRGELSGDLAGIPAATLIVSYEDSASRTIKPRLMAAGADLALVHRVGARRGRLRDLVSLPDDIDSIRGLARETGARFVIVDPLSASLNGDIDAHRDQHVRRALAPLVALAEELDLAILALTHWNKAPGGDSLSRVLGSRGLTAAVRSVLAFGLPPDAEDGSPVRVLAHAACNVGAQAPSLACRVEAGEVIGADNLTISTSRLVIVGETDDQADDLLVTRTSDDREDRDRAIEWLEELGDGGRHDSAGIKERAKAENISTKVLRRARRTLGVEHDRVGFPAVTMWRLTVVPSQSANNGHDRNGHHRETPENAGDSRDPDSQWGPFPETGTTAPEDGSTDQAA